MNQRCSLILAASSLTWTYEQITEESGLAQAGSVGGQPTCGGPRDTFSGPVLVCSDSLWTALTFVNFFFTRNKTFGRLSSATGI